MEVPFLDLPIQHAALKEEILSAWSALLDRAGFIGGAPVSQLEEEFAAACKAKHCIAVSNGTDALFLIYKALGLSSEDEVIVPANTFIATSESLTAAGAQVVFADCLPGTYNLDPASVEKATTPRTKGIVAVHLYGQPADIDALDAVARRHGLWLVEDAAQAHLSEYKGRRIGSIGIASAFSFYPGKNLGACGDAGAITTGDAELARRIRILRDHGSEKKYAHQVEGFNMRCDALQAAALRIKLRHLPGWNQARRRVAARYLERLRRVEDIVLPEVAPGCLPVWHLFVVQVPARDQVQQTLKELGVQTGLHYPVPLHLQQAYAHLGYGDGAFPVAESVAKRLLSLPMFAEMTDAQIDYVCDSLIRAVAAAAVPAN
jgi:dTDP-3-amino-3,4,6-trideoxy-alpha-D-glucose transaminase